MFTTGRRKERAGVDADRLIAGLEDEFDLLRLEEYSADLEREEIRLIDEAERFRGNLEARLGWWRPFVIRPRVFWLSIRRESLAEKRRWYRSLEEEIRFSLRLAKARDAGE